LSVIRKQRLTEAEHTAPVAGRRRKALESKTKFGDRLASGATKMGRNWLILFPCSLKLIDI
jgi:hypothetical protein